jgi:hypothetical protein
MELKELANVEKFNAFVYAVKKEGIHLEFCENI